MDISRINAFIANYDRCSFEGFAPDTCTVVLRLEADGGPHEDLNPRLMFDDARVLHLPRVIHATIQLRLATASEMAQVIPSENYSPEEGGQCFLLQARAQDLGYYVWADSVRLEGVPADWPYHSF